MARTKTTRAKRKLKIKGKNGLNISFEEEKKAETEVLKIIQNMCEIGYLLKTIIHFINRYDSHFQDVEL